MKVKEVIEQLQRFVELGDEDAEFTLFDLTNDRRLVSDPDTDEWDFEILRGDNEIVIEFN